MKDILKEVLKTREFRDLLTDYLARKVSNEYHFSDIEGDLIKKEIRKIVRDEAKLAVMEVAQNYYEMHSIRSQIEEALKSYTKEQILSLIIKKV